MSPKGPSTASYPIVVGPRVFSGDHRQLVEGVAARVDADVGGLVGVFCAEVLRGERGGGGWGKIVL